MTHARRVWLLERIARIEKRGFIEVEEVYPLLHWCRELIDAVEPEPWQQRLPIEDVA